MKVSSRLFLHIRPLLKIFCQKHRIVQINVRHNRIVNIRHIRLKCQHVNRFPILKKVCFFNLVYQKHIVIEINKLF